jgi:hypothetical protein
MNDMQPPEAILVATPEPIAPTKRAGRPKGSKNKPKVAPVAKVAKPEINPETVIENLQKMLNKEVADHDMAKLEIDFLKKNEEELKRMNRSLSSVIVYLESKLREAWSDS